MAEIKSLDLGTEEDICWETAIDGVVGEIDGENGQRTVLPEEGEG